MNEPRSYYRGTVKEELVVFTIFVCLLVPAELLILPLFGVG